MQCAEMLKDLSKAELLDLLQRHHIYLNKSDVIWSKYKVAREAEDRAFDAWVRASAAESCACQMVIKSTDRSYRRAFDAWIDAAKKEKHHNRQRDIARKRRDALYEQWLEAVKQERLGDRHD